MDFNTFNYFAQNINPWLNNPYFYIFNLERNLGLLATKINEISQINNKLSNEIKDVYSKYNLQEEKINKLKKTNNFLMRKSKKNYNKYLNLEKKINEIEKVFIEEDEDEHICDDCRKLEENNEDNDNDEDDISETTEEDCECREDKKDINEKDDGELFNNIIQNIIKNKLNNESKKDKPFGGIIIDMSEGGKITNNNTSGINPILSLIKSFGEKEKKEEVVIQNGNQDIETQHDFSKLEKFEVENLDTNINDIGDLIELANKFPIEKRGDLKLEKIDGLYEYDNKYYGINLEVLNKLNKPLSYLNNMIGLKDIKKQILEMIMYYMQEFEKGSSNMLHTIIEGPPGVGKTEIGKILAEVYSALGIIPSNKFKLVKRTDLIGEYVGHTAHKTQKAIDEAEGGVLFIDEAYSLGGGSEKSDTFSKECLDVLNQNLSENKKKLIVIIAGYKEQLESSFFCYNPGLKRRFPFKYTIDGYSASELKDIYIKKVKDINWSIDKDITEKYLCKFFSDNKDEFKHFGGDIENFILNSKFTHSKRVFNTHPFKRKIITKEDFDSAFERFKKNKKNKEDQIPFGLFI